jgi:outer membrane protein assembly factor BamB
MKTRLLPLLVLLAGLSAAAGAFAPAPAGRGGNDWPQWRGPNRDDVSRETGLLQDWPAGGPKLLWTYDDAGAGFSGPAVVGDVLYTMGAKDEKEWLYALDVRGPKQLWAAEVGPLLVNGWGDGPRGTPTVDGEYVYALGGQGHLVCVKAATGDKVWTKRLKEDLGGAFQGVWGYTESPLVDGDQVVCTPGGPNGSVAAFDKKTGEVRWRTKGLPDKASYASLVSADFGGDRQYVGMTEDHIVGVARDGRVLWSFARKGPVAAIPTPVVSGDLVFVTSAYDAGCVLLRVQSEGGKFRAEEVYREDQKFERMVNHHGGVVLVEGHLYGYSEGKKGRGPSQWECQELKTGNVLWGEGKALGKGALTYADGRLYCYSEKEGTAALAAASPKGWEEHGRFTIPQQTKLKRKAGLIWTHPVVANGRLYLRDQDLIFCYDVKAR